VSNAIVVKLDHRLAGLARRIGFSFTRYADDLAFSGDDAGQVHALRCLAQRIIQDEGFAVNHTKTRILRRGARQCITGVVVNEVLGLPRHERRRLRAALHRARRQAERDGQPVQIDSALRGKLAYLNMLNPTQAARLQASPAQAESVLRPAQTSSPLQGEGQGGHGDIGSKPPP
jgi:retron-type reverse transcriptase